MQNKLQLVQILRGLAALSVLLFHLDIHSRYYFGHTPIPFNYGFLGVDFFFALSGFIITYIHFNDIKAKKNVYAFIRKRFIRIIPFYWLVLLAAVAFDYPAFDWKPSLKTALDPATAEGWEVIIKNIFLFPLPADGMIIGASWTLTYEIVFYAVFALAIAIGWQITKWILAVWISLIVFHAVVAPSASFPSTVSSPLVIEFLCGCLAGYLFTNNRMAGSKRILALASFFVLCFTAWFIFLPFPFRHIFFTTLMGTASALVIYAAAVWDKMKKFTWLRMPFFLLIGDASYSIYITHSLIIANVCRKLTVLYNIPAFDTWQKNILIAVIGAATVLAGCAIHLCIERPLLKYLGRSRHLSLLPTSADLPKNR